MIIRKTFSQLSNHQKRVQAYSEDELTKMYNQWVNEKKIPVEIQVVELGQKYVLKLEECKTGRLLEKYIRQVQKYLYGGYKNQDNLEVLEGKWPAPDEEEVAEAVTSAYLKLVKPSKPVAPVNTTNK